jgi:hypothetical protein
MAAIDWTPTPTRHDAHSLLTENMIADGTFERVEADMAAFDAGSLNLIADVIDIDKLRARLG